MIFDHPESLAVLRMFAKDPKHWKTAEDIRKAIEWLESPDHAYSGATWKRVRALEDHKILDGRKAPGKDAGRQWRLAADANIKRATGGLDVLRLDKEEILQAGSDVRRTRVEYTPSAFLVAGSGRAKAERALRQCPSPWVLAERMTLIKWNNPELA